MRKLTLVSLSALALAGCAATSDALSGPPLVAEEVTPAPAVYAPVIPKGTGIFAEASTP